ncbi:TetR/AcrR family transcriptional regulator [Vibrio jasicida]|uniref:TetR/AcrR family transcriptional regulator n=1 Tax=Vibrio TaxID=662 RepID=UPI0040697021
MARITAEQRASNKAEYDALILRIFMEEGWDHVTYDRLSKELGIRKSTLQGYYENRLMFATALQGKILPHVMQKLDVNSSEGFIRSWFDAYWDHEDHVFREVVRMLVTSVVDSGSGAVQIKRAINQIELVLSNNIGKEEARNTMEIVFGKIIFLYMEQLVSK